MTRKMTFCEKFSNHHQNVLALFSSKTLTAKIRKAEEHFNSGLKIFRNEGSFGLEGLY